MPIQTFSTAPDFGAQLEKKPRVRRAQFGDGYQQRVGDGINTQPESWSLTFSARTPAERDEIMSFLEARGGIEAFLWTTPRGTSGKFICQEWGGSPQSAAAHTVTAKFEQVFEP